MAKHNVESLHILLSFSCVNKNDHEFGFARKTLMFHRNGMHIISAQTTVNLIRTVFPLQQKQQSATRILCVLKSRRADRALHRNLSNQS